MATALERDSPTSSHPMQVFSTADFGGCSVTIPHKVDVMQYLDDLSGAAQTIGAVNTVWKDETGRLVGDNTGAYGGKGKEGTQ